MGRIYKDDLPDGVSEMFFAEGLDRANHIERVQQIHAA
jgi:hypothetical protein